MSHGPVVEKREEPPYESNVAKGAKEEVRGGGLVGVVTSAISEQGMPALQTIQQLIIIWYDAQNAPELTYIHITNITICTTYNEQL